jgi:hypothetical protein
MARAMSQAYLASVCLAPVESYDPKSVMDFVSAQVLVLASLVLLF